MPILVIRMILLVFELSQKCEGLFEISSMPYGHRIGTNCVRTDPPVVSIDSNFVGVHGVLTLFCGGETQTCHDDRVVELKEQLVVEEVDGEGQKGRRERSSQRERAIDGMEMTM